MKKLLLAVFYCIGAFLMTTQTASATHLMGGNMTYEYLGLNSGTGLYDYRVTLKIYRLCDPGSSQLPISTSLGAYQNNPGNPNLKQRIALATLNLISQQAIVPPNAGASCSFAPNVCVEEGVYQTTISVPANTTGYYFMADRCCRNNNIDNLNNPGATGQAYYAYAPNPTIDNNSPTFAVPPVPFICANDTVSILNQAIDVDGDSLSYAFVTPYAGISSSGSPNPTAPTNYTWPIPTVTYATNFSNTTPFGLNSYAAIDATTGLGVYVSPNQGYYVVAVEISEYRNGVLIGVSRLDIQIIVITCPTNPAPAISSSQTTYTIQEGQTLCFNVGYTDPNGDSLFLTHTGDIFNSTLVNPTATLANASGDSVVSSQFCWTTSCNQGRTTPYQFSTSATDNGCPAKVTNTVYTINVINTPAPTVMNGPDTLCLNAATGIAYSVASTSGYTYQWLVTNGSQVSGTNTASATVNFTSSGLATVSIIALNPFGCPSDTLTKTVFIKPQPSAIAGSDVSFCSGGSATLGTSTTSGYSYSWSPATNLSSGSISNPVVTIGNTGTAPSSTTYILTTTFDGCTNKDTVVVTSNPFPVANAGNNASICSGSSAPLGTLATTGYTYSWTPSSGLSNGSISNPVFSLTNTGNVPDTLQYVVLVSNGFSCSTTDTVQVIVRPVPTAVAGIDTIFCSGGSGTIGSVTTSGYAYSWSPSTGLTSPTGSSSTVSLTNSTTANDTVSYILTTTWFGCTAKDTVKVIVKPVPTANAGSNLYLCSGVNGQLGTISTSGYNYTWTPATGLSNPNVSNPIVSLTNNGITTDTTFYYLNTDLAGCQNYDTVRVVIGPVPTANAGLNQTICSGQSVTIGTTATSGYTYSWSPATGLNSTTLSDPTSSATNSGSSPITITYSVIATWFGCKDTATVDVTIKPVPVSVAGNNQLLCSGSTVQLGGTTTNGYTYVWTPGTNLNDSLISNPTLTDTTTGLTPDTLLYSVTTELNGCISSDTVQVVLSPVPTAQAGNDITFCSGQSGTIGDLAISNYNYSWSPATGLGNASQASTSVTLTNNTTAVITNNYILTTNLFGCIDNDTVAVNVKPLPISEAGAAVSSCDGDTVTIGAIATNGYTYVWTPGAGLSSDTSATTQVYISNTGAAASTVYYTVTTTLNGCTTSDSVAVTSNPLPIVTAQAAPAAICFGQSTSITASGATSYNWVELANPGVSVGTGSTLSVTPQSTTTYIVEGTSSVNCINYDTITITVNPLPIVQILSASTDLCNGDTLTLTASGATTYNWIDLTSGNSLGSSSTINVFPSANTSYALVGTDGNSCVNSDTIDVTVNPAPTINAITGTLSVCPGSNGVQYWVVNPNSTSIYNWFVTNGTIATGQGNDTISIDWSGTQSPAIISVIEVTDLGCPSDSVQLQVNINIVLDPVAPTGASTLCADLAQNIPYSTTNTPGSIYTWHIQGGSIVSGDGTSNVIVDWNVTGPQVVALWYDENSTTIDTVCAGVSDTLYVTINPTPITSAITGNNAICVGDSSTFSVVNTIGSTYNWSITGGTLNNISTSNTISATLTTVPGATITVQETNSYGCIGTPVTYNVTVNALPNADAGTNDTICNGTTTVLNASGGTSYTWTTNSTLDNLTISNPVANPSSTTTYYVLVTDANGCKNSDSVTVLVNQLPNVIASSNAAICIGASTTITGSGATNYSWSPATGLDNSNISNPTANPTSTTTYVVIGTDNNGCSNSDSTTITVNPLPTAVVSTGGIICNGGSISLTASGGTSYSWTPATGLNNATIDNPIASPTTTTTYTVIVTDANGCTDDDQVTVDVNDQPVASFAIDSAITVIGCEGVEITLINNSTFALNYEWNFGDGTTSIDANPNHIFAFGSSNGITLIAYNNQCSDTLVTPFSPGQLADYFSNIPNIFTPNNDGINDCFNLGANTKFEDCSSWEIYNRWGTKVYTSSTAQPCWNGKKDNTGEDQPAGTYFYILKAGNADYKGTVMLNR
ncbi:MAG: gliding motility-associated C-terminal domain-containing protein [Bacteroidota bacterium]|jgi:gliding motility-associated-like protein